MSYLSYGDECSSKQQLIWCFLWNGTDLMSTGMVPADSLADRAIDDSAWSLAPRKGESCQGPTPPFQVEAGNYHEGTCK